MKQLQCVSHCFKSFASIESPDPYNYLWIGIIIITIGPRFSVLSKSMHKEVTSRQFNQSLGS